MAGGQVHPDSESVGTWAKRCYLAARAVMDSVLRPHDLGSTQWYVLAQLAAVGPMMQRDLMRTLSIEKATLSGIVATLVRKGFVAQLPDSVDLRQRRLQLTAAGKALWDGLPDLSFVRSVAFEGIDAADLATAIRVLKAATARLDDLSQKAIGP